MKPDPKKAAAISAVAACIKLEEEAALSMEPESLDAAGVVETPAEERPAAAPVVWGLSGRQQQMHMRNLMQMKALQRAMVRQR